MSVKTPNEKTGAARIGRREFLWIGGAGLFVGCTSRFGVVDAAETPVVRFGMVTDIHYADHDPDKAPCGVVGRRYYRESLRKLDEAVSVFNTRGLDFAIELGDFKDDSGASLLWRISLGSRSRSRASTARVTISPATMTSTASRLTSFSRGFRTTALCPRQAIIRSSGARSSSSC